MEFPPDVSAEHVADRVPGDRASRVPLWLALLVGAFGVLVLSGGVLLAMTLRHVARVAPAIQSPTDVVLTLGDDLDKDENGRTNILLLGSGGKDWDEGTDLTDSIMVASIDETGKRVTLISIPRDLYVNIPGYGMSRLNYVWPFGKKSAEPGTIPELPKQVFQTITGLDIHYVLKVDFRGFTRLIDALGGIDVVVERAFKDSMYPTVDYGYQTVSFEAGPTTLSGDQALKFVRSRHASGQEGTDFARSRRQQIVIQGVRARLMDRALLDDPARLTELVNLVNEHYTTDVTVSQMLTLARLAKTIGKDSILSFNLSVETGDGLLREPDEVERNTKYGGAFFIMPSDPTFETIHREIGRILDNPDLLKAPTTVVVLNASKQPGLAGGVADLMKLRRFKVVSIGNAKNRELPQTIVVDRAGTHPEEAKAVADLLGGVVGSSPADEPLAAASDLIIYLAQPSIGSQAPPPPSNAEPTT